MNFDKVWPVLLLLSLAIVIAGILLLPGILLLLLGFV
jgi:hypothetical protein